MSCCSVFRSNAIGKKSQTPGTYIVVDCTDSSIVLALDLEGLGVDAENYLFKRLPSDISDGLIHE